MNYEVKLLDGIDNLGFNASPELVNELLGEPHETEEIDNIIDGSVETISWSYPGQELLLYFDVSCGQPKLRMIESSHSELLLAGKKLFELSRQEIIQLMTSLGYSELEEEDETWGEHRISFDDAQADFYFEGDKLNLVSWSRY